MLVPSSTVGPAEAVKSLVTEAAVTTLTVIVTCSVSDTPAAVLTVSFTMNVPAVLKVWLKSFVVALVTSVFPGDVRTSHVCPVLVVFTTVEVLVNWIVVP